MSDARIMLGRAALLANQCWTVSPFVLYLDNVFAETQNATSKPTTNQRSYHHEILRGGYVRHNILAFLGRRHRRPGKVTLENVAVGYICS